ncbi:MAG TPA: class I SAM-dependent methyltransferase [Anaerolineaceae bacterium]|nr:class I SAM-dependent methyltransferase [Anaerolineaceae bacterium]
MKSDKPPRLMLRLLRFFFYHFYRSLSWSYDLVAWIVSGGRWTSWVLASLRFIQGPRVLEIGHGPGHLQLALRQEGFDAFGIDLSRQMGRRAYRNLTRSSESPLPQPPCLARASSFAIPFSASHFDTAVSTFPSEYIIDKRTLSEVFRVLKPEGKFIVILTGWITDPRPLHRILTWLFRITGESAELDPKLEIPFREVGFLTKTQWISLGTSRVFLIEATKSA